MRRCINETAAKAMVHSMITSKLDYCNAILYIWSARVNAKALHQGSESPACFISQHGKYEHISLAAYTSTYSL